MMTTMTTTMLRSVSAALCLCTLALTTAAQAQGPAPMIGEIEGASFRAYPLAVPDFRTSRQASDSINTSAAALGAIVRRDLGLTGVFKILDVRSFIDTDGLTLGTVKFDDWLNVGADAVVKSSVRPKGNGYVVEVRVFEVASARESFSESYAGTQDSVRETGHRIADDLYRHFTGEPGIASTKIAVVRKRAGSKHLFLLDADGERIQQLTTEGTLDLLPAFTPDGRRILFTSYRYDNPDLLSYDMQSGAITKVSTQPGLNTGGKQQPGGSQVVLTLSKDGNSELYLIDMSGRISQRLTKSWGIDTSPEWSPDGKKIAFVSSRAGNPHIYLMNADGTEQRRLTFQGTYNQQPSYSPRGTHIAFTARDEFNRFDIFLYSLENKEITRLTQDQGNNEDPSFSPNGRLIAFISNRSGQKEVWVMNLDGSHQMRLTATGEFSTPSWGPLTKR
jgi:TolB protein